MSSLGRICDSFLRAPSRPFGAWPSGPSFYIGEQVNDLFGEVPVTPQAERRGKHYTAPAGYAAPPGTGPADETCASCKHLYRNRMAKTYLKCILMRGKWTGGRKTDVLSRSPACSKWEVSA